MRNLWLLVLLFSAAAPARGQLAVRGETVYTMNGSPIQDGVVLVRDGRIERVGPAAGITIPDGYRLLTARVVTPGLVDAHTVVGLAGIYNYDHDQDQLERSDPVQPALRAIDAYNPREELVAWLRDHGVTTLHTGHGPGAVVSGQTMIVKTSGETVEQVLVDSTTMLAATLGPSVSRNYNNRPGTRSRSVAMLREALVKAQEYERKNGNEDASKRPGRDLTLETLSAALRGEIPIMMTAQEAPEIAVALRLAEEFGFRLVLDGAAESYLMIDRILEAGVPVILHPAMARPQRELRNSSFETAAKLKAAGIPFAFQSGYEGYVPKTRVVLFEAAIAAANGLSFEEALAAITIDAARIIGVEDRVGSIEAGKDADIVLFDGDPFEYTSHVCAVVIGGRVVSETCM